MAKGIRVNQLAKELGVESKMILEKCRKEGLGASVPNHMSTLSAGLAETVREWFHAGHSEVATAVETAAPVAMEELAKPKAKPRPSRRKKKGDETPDTTEDSTPTAIAPEAEESAATEVPAEETPAKPQRTRTKAEKPPRTKLVEAPVETPAVPPAVAAEAPVPADLAVEALPPLESPAPETPHVPPAVAAPEAPGEPALALEAPATMPAAPAAPEGTPVSTPDGAHRPTPNRPTVTLANRDTIAVVRARITPAPMLKKLEPAKIQGPRVVRVEKEETVAVRGPRGPRLPRGQQEGESGVTPAGPRGGRGVKVAEEDSEEEKKKAAKTARTLSSRRRGPDGRRGEAEAKLREFSEQDLEERRTRLNAAGDARRVIDSHLKKQSDRLGGGPAKSIVQKGAPVEIEEPITVRTLAEALGVKSNDVIAKLMRQGVFANLNQSLDPDAAAVLALEYNIELQVRKPQTEEERMQETFERRQGRPEDMVLRPPVVAILGHVDHGKTSLLDKIRHANVAAGEAGGITQHTAAWTVEVNGKRVTFIDTPGHQAFTSMRARGANMTDVVVLVVSAAEGVQPQTVESINHAKAAGVPIVVAMNKIDRSDINPDMVLGQLAKEGLNPVEWGGETEVIRTSAATGKGIPDLIEILDLQAELLELQTDPTAPARGMVIEARMEEGLGSVATVLIQDGTLRAGDIMLAGGAYGRVRSLHNDLNQQIDQATASMPVLVAGLSELPNAGDKVYVVSTLELARSITESRREQNRNLQLAGRNQVSAGNLLATMKAADIQMINLIVKGDVAGSVETLVKSLAGTGSDEVQVRVIHSGVGAISESDVELAMATKAKPTDNRVAIIGFHVVPEDAARALAERNHIDVKLYRVIYEIFDDLKKAMSGMLAPEHREKLHGHLEIRQVYRYSKVGNIAGCIVTDGHVQRGSKIRLIRDGVVITQDLTMESLRRLKDDVREVKAGLECGVKLAGYDDIKAGDRLEAYVREVFERTL